MMNPSPLMHFNGTSHTLFQWVAELPIERETRLASLLRAYQQQLEHEGGVQTPDVTLLYEAQSLLEMRLREGEPDAELAHLAMDLYYHLEVWDSLLEVLACYQAQGLPPYEEAWARWIAVDCLGAKRSCAHLIEQQRALVQWAQQTLPLEHWLFTLHDGTHALCWVKRGQQAEWFELFTMLMEAVPPTPGNRHDRFQTLRTAIGVTRFAEEQERALSLIKPLYKAAQEEIPGEDTEDYVVETQAVHIEVLAALGQKEQVRVIGQRATAQLMRWKEQRGALTLTQKRQMRRLFHNLASSLYEAGEYELAIPLFEHAIAYDIFSPHTFTWLAASLCAAGHDHERVFALLEQAKAHNASGTILPQIAALPHFAALREDARFQRVIAHA
jgi:tetratricopeptide (TPR) repeat protein